MKISLGTLFFLILLSAGRSHAESDQLVDQFKALFPGGRHSHQSVVATDSEGMIKQYLMKQHPDEDTSDYKFDSEGGIIRKNIRMAGIIPPQLLNQAISAAFNIDDLHFAELLR